MLAVMRRLVALEKEFCRATAEEKRLERLADGLQQEVEAKYYMCAAPPDAQPLAPLLGGAWPPSAPKLSARWCRDLAKEPARQ